MQASTNIHACISHHAIMHHASTNMHACKNQSNNHSINSDNDNTLFEHRYIVAPVVVQALQALLCLWHIDIFMF